MKQDSYSCFVLSFPDLVDSFPKNVDFVRILFTHHTSFVDFVLNWLVGEAFLLAAMPPLLFNKRYGERLKADMIKAGFSENQYYNMRRTGADFLIIQALMLMKFLSAPGRHFGLSGEDEDD